MVEYRRREGAEAGESRSSPNEVITRRVHTQTDKARGAIKKKRRKRREIFIGLISDAWGGWVDVIVVLHSHTKRRRERGQQQLSTQQFAREKGVCVCVCVLGICFRRHIWRRFNHRCKRGAHAYWAGDVINAPLRARRPKEGIANVNGKRFRFSPAYNIISPLPWLARYEPIRLGPFKRPFDIDAAAAAIQHDSCSSSSTSDDQIWNSTQLLPLLFP